MRRSLSLALFAAVLAAPGAASAADDGPFFKAGDRVVFLGDSITEQYQYSTYMELYLTTRFPDGKFVFLNAGIGGDTAHGGAARFKAHVLDEKPTAVTINFGMNDGGYGKFNEGGNKLFRDKTAEMLKMAKDAGVRVAVCSPNAVDPRVKSNGPEYFETQKQFYAPLKGIADAGGARFADQYAATRAEIEAMTKDDPQAKVAKPYYDGFHTAPPGGLIMAHAILTGLKEPALVSHVTVTVGKADAAAENCTVTDVKATPTAVSFTRTDKALPLPIQENWVPMMKYLGDLKDLNDYSLTVQTLADGNYDVAIDGAKVATVTAKDLTAGVNLGNAMAGPVYAQAQKVFAAIQDKNNLVRARFFEVHRFNPPGWLKIDNLAELKKAELDKRMGAIEAKQAAVYALAKPAPHKWTVTPAK